MFTIGEFKGNVVISLKTSEEDRFGMTFGLTKAKLILDNVDNIRKFYEDNKDKIKRKIETPPNE
ncbi:MAG: hypothetical protein JNK54_09205 [Elusimicrobia bacterium]|nr:hypothetical protein [Elusimicrobiota bacterium]